MKIEKKNELKERSRSFAAIDPRLFLLLISIFTGFEFLALIKTVYFLRKNNFPISQIPLELFLFDWFAVVSFIYIIALNTRFLLNRKIAWRYIFIFHFGMAMVVNALLRFLFESYTFIKSNTLHNFTLEYFFNRYMAYIDINYLLYFVMIFVIYAYYYTEQIKQAEGQKRVLENHLLQTKLKLLKGQIQPHFLFNTLNSIVCLIQSDQKKAAKTLVSLSYLLRKTLSLQDEQLVKVETELNILDTYLDIVNTRFGDQVTVEKQIDPAVLNNKIPALIIQPLVENSIKHSFDSEKDKLKINISLKIENNSVLIEVENDGCPLSSTKNKPGSGTGTSNIVSRLSSLYDKQFTFTMNNLHQAKGVITRISFPV